MKSRLPLRSALLSRRGVVAGSALAAVLITGGAYAELAMSDTEGSDTPGHSASATPAAAPSGPVRPASGSVMQIIAHPDDDLFFMNPDTGQSLRSGRPMTSVYVTAGEADGVNAPPPKKPGGPKPLVDKAKYSEARQNGIRGAYAQMATGDRASAWTRSAIPTAGGGTAEVDTLNARPDIHLVWVQLREAGTINGNQPHSLRGLWNGQVTTLASEISSGSPARPFAYTKEQVVKTLAGLMERFRPTHVRTLDPTPGKEGKLHKIVDHQDHIYSARFAQAALQLYAKSVNHPNFSVQTYFGYNTSYLPHTFAKPAADAKADIVKTYAWMNPNDNYCDSVAGCGDRKVSVRPYGNNWAQSVRYSRTNSTSWLQTGTDGSLWAFGVLDQQLAVWHKAPGANGSWGSPTLLPGDGMDSGVSATRLPDGRLAVFGTRTLFGVRPHRLPPRGGGRGADGAGRRVRSVAFARLARPERQRRRLRHVHADCGGGRLRQAHRVPARRRPPAALREPDRGRRAGPRGPTSAAPTSPVTRSRPPTAPVASTSSPAPRSRC